MRGKHIRALVLACIMLTSAVAVAVPASTLATAQPSDAGPPGMVGVPSENVGPPDHANAGGNSNGGGPPEHALDNIPQHAAAWDVHASNHSEDLIVEVTATSEGDLKMILSDDANHDGREVAVAASTLEETAGARPEVVWGVHEDGDRWTSEIEYSDGYATFSVPRFSSNEVTFSGGITLSGSEAADGSQYRYELSSLDQVGDYRINVTGVESTAPASTSGTLSNGQTLPISVGGTTSPRNETVTLEGRETTSSFSSSGTGSGTISVDGNQPAESIDVEFEGSTSTNSRTISRTGLSSGSSTSIDVGGNIDPSGPASGEPELTVTANGQTASRNMVNYHGDGATDSGWNPGLAWESGGRSDFEITSPEDGQLNEITFDTVVNGDDMPSDVRVNIYIARESADGITGDGTHVATWDPTWSNGPQTVSLDTPISVSQDETLSLSAEPTNTWSYESELNVASDDSVSQSWIHQGYNNEYDDIGDITTHVVADASSVSVSSSSTTASLGTIADGSSATTGIDLSQSDSSLSVSGDNLASADLSVDLTERTATEDPSIDLSGDGNADASHSGILTSGQTATASAPDGSLSSGSNSVSTSTAVGPAPSWTVSGTEVTATEDPSATVGSTTVSHSGILGPGETVSEPVTLSTGSNSVDVSTGGQVDVSSSWTEVTETRDPTITVNGYQTTHAGVIATGETTSLATNEAWLENGTNNVTITTNSPADGPDSLVGFGYSHDAGAVTTSADVSATTWSESVNVSHTFPSDQVDATATIPMHDRVASIRDIEIRVNGTSWQPISESDYELEGTDLNVTLGDMAAGTTIELRATGSKVGVSNGRIEVLEPTVEGDSLNSMIEVVERSEDFAIDVANTSESERVHYTASESWDASSYAVVKASGEQSIRMPDASNGSTTRVKTAPLEVHPETGSAEVIVYDPDEPSFRVRPGETPGSTVDIGWMDAASEVKYDLRNEDDDPVDTSTANSPVWFTAPLEAATYTIVESPPNEPRVAGPTGQEGGGLVPGWMLLLLGVAGALAVLMLVSRRVGSDGGRGSDGIGTGTMLFLVGAAVIAVIAAELLTADPLPSVLLDSIAEATRTASGPLAALGIGIAMLVGLWQVDVRTQADVPRTVSVPAVILVVVFVVETVAPGAILGPISEGFETVAPVVILSAVAGGAYLLREWLRARKQEASTPDTQVTLDLGDGGNGGS